MGAKAKKKWREARKVWREALATRTGMICYLLKRCLDLTALNAKATCELEEMMKKHFPQPKPEGVQRARVDSREWTSWKQTNRPHHSSGLL